MKIRHSIVCLVPLVAGCATLAANKRMPASLADNTFTPQRPPADQYGSDPARTCPSYGVLGIVIPEMDDKAKQSGKPGPQADGRLCAMAEAFLSWERKENPPASVMSFASWYFGLPATVRNMAFSMMKTEEARNIADSVPPFIDEGIEDVSVPPIYGLATMRRAKNETQLVVLTESTPVELDPLPRRLELHGKAVLSGHLRAKLTGTTKVLVCGPNGKLQSFPATGKDLHADLECGDLPGWIDVEVRVEDEGSVNTLARFPIACGIPLPTSVSIPPATPPAVDPAAGERELLEAINADRRNGALAPLAWDDSVGAVARSLSQGLADDVHKGANTAMVDPVERLKAADVISSLILENPAQAQTVGEAKAAMSVSPVFRANYMNSDATHAGIGVAPATDPSGRTSVIVTELFVRELPVIDIEATRQKVRDAIGRKRSDARAPPLKDDPGLDAVAQSYAKELAAAKGNISKAKADELLRPLYKGYLSLTTVPGVLVNPLEFAETPDMVGKGTVLGLGIAQGTHPNLGKNAIFLFAIIGTKR
jgi:uncharacterized protein YkwD